MYGLVLALTVIGGVICGAHFVAAAIELAANRKKTKAEAVAQAISDANHYRDAHKVVTVDQKPSHAQAFGYDVQDLFHAGRR